MPARMSAAPIPLTFVDGSEYKFSPLTDKDIDELDSWLQAHVIEIARRSLPPDAIQADRDETLILAMREAPKTTFFSTEGQRMIATMQGMMQLLYLSVRKCHPDITMDQIRFQVFNPENVKRINQAFMEANAVPSNGKEKPTKNSHRASEKK